MSRTSNSCSRRSSYISKLLSVAYAGVFATSILAAIMSPELKALSWAVVFLAILTGGSVDWLGIACSISKILLAAAAFAGIVLAGASGDGEVARPPARLAGLSTRPSEPEPAVSKVSLEPAGEFRGQQRVWQQAPAYHLTRYETQDSVKPSAAKWLGGPSKGYPKKTGEPPLALRAAQIQEDVKSDGDATAFDAEADKKHRQALTSMFGQERLRQEEMQRNINQFTQPEPAPKTETVIAGASIFDHTPLCCQNKHAKLDKAYQEYAFYAQRYPHMAQHFAMIISMQCEYCAYCAYQQPLPTSIKPVEPPHTENAVYPACPEYHANSATTCNIPSQQEATATYPDAFTPVGSKRCSTWADSPNGLKLNGQWIVQPPIQPSGPTNLGAPQPSAMPSNQPPGHTGLGAPQPAATAPNPLLSLNADNARLQAQQWMRTVYEGESYLRGALKQKNSRAAWETAVQDYRVNDYCNYISDKVNWIREWTAPNDVWDQSKLSANHLANGKVKLKGSHYDKLLGLLKAGAERGVDVRVDQAKNALIRFQYQPFA